MYIYIINYIIVLVRIPRLNTSTIYTYLYVLAAPRTITKWRSVPLQTATFGLVLCFEASNNFKVKGAWVDAIMVKLYI